MFPSEYLFFATPNTFFILSHLYSDYFRGFRGKATSPTKYNGTLMLVPGMFLIGGTFKSPELHAFPKLEFLKNTAIIFTFMGSYINQCEAADGISHT